MRRRLWLLHSWMGLVAGLGLLVIGTSGSLLVFHEELEQLLQTALVRVDRTGPRQPLDRLLAATREQLPEHEVVGWLPQRTNGAMADVLYVIRRGTNEWQVATLDPASGRLLATPRRGTMTLTGWLLELHYAFFADHVGLVVAGGFGVLLCLLGVTGVWLYRDFWRHFLTLRWGRGWRVLSSDVHKGIGIASTMFNLLLGGTGAYWNFTHVIGEWGQEEQPVLRERLYRADVSLEALTADASRRLPGFRTNFISLPWKAGAGITLWGAVEPASRWRSPYGSTVVFDEQTGAHRSTHDVRTQPTWRQVVDAFTPLHYGTFGGWPVKILWCAAGLAPGTLAVSGFTIWWLRRRRSPGDGPRAVKKA